MTEHHRVSPKKERRIHPARNTAPLPLDMDRKSNRGFMKIDPWKNEWLFHKIDHFPPEGRADVEVCARVLAVHVRAFAR